MWIAARVVRRNRFRVVRESCTCTSRFSCFVIAVGVNKKKKVIGDDLESGFHLVAMVQEVMYCDNLTPRSMMYFLRSFFYVTCSSADLRPC